MDDWNSKTGRYSPQWDALEKRALDVRIAWRKRSESIITVICHAGFLRHIVNLPREHIWRNVEARAYRFVAAKEGDNEDMAILERIGLDEEATILGETEFKLVETH